MSVPTPDRWTELDALFAEALARPVDERTAFLRAACGDDPALYAEVAALLDDSAAAEKALGESATAYVAPLLPGLRDALAEGDVTAELPPGARLGPYRVAGALGRGGMGTVYRAERADGTFHKEVALKVVRRGLDTDDVLARFRRERQVLAGLDHPGIARLLDGGATDDGRPFLVMELVEGRPITAYADDERLSVAARLALFERASEAVQHAHRRLVVHRDLKPSNVLVTDDGAVKLLDFGIAKLLDPEAADGRLRTRTGVRPLTPAYAAPEQLLGQPVTTATDVYALGVLLHELLAGERPTGEGEVLHAPSERVTERAAQARALPADRLRRRLRGDLDTIVLKALREDPERRYPSVEALLDDLRRHREGLPVHARPESIAYRVGSFVRRHRVGVATSAASVGVLVVALVAVSFQQQATARERDRAERELTQKEEVVVLLTDLLGEADPLVAQGDTLNVYELLARAEGRVGEATGYAPDVRAHLLHALGAVYLNMAVYDRAGPLLAEALDLRRELYPDSLHADVVNTLGLVGRLAREQGDLDRAVDLHERALALRRRLHPTDVAALAQALDELALSQHLDGDREAAEANFRAAVASFRSGVPDPRLAATLGHLADLLFDADRLDEAEVLLREAVALDRARYGDGHPHVADRILSHGRVLQYSHRFDDALPLFEEALAINRAVFDETHPSVTKVLYSLASLHHGQGDPTVAAALYRQVIRADSARLGVTHPDYTETVFSYGQLLRESGDPGAAVPLIRSAYDADTVTFGPDHPYVLIKAGDLGAALTDLGRTSEAEPLLRGAVSGLERELGADHWRVAVARRNLGACLAAQRRYDEAEPHLLHGYEVLLARKGPDLYYTVEARAHLVALYEAWGRSAAAERYGSGGSL